MQNNNNITETELKNREALKKKAMFEEMMRTQNHAKCLKQELTMAYFVNNLLLIETKN
jgi:hypothetical protein